MGIIIIPLSIIGILYLLSVFLVFALLSYLDDEFDIISFVNEDTKNSIFGVLSCVIGACIAFIILITFD